MYMYICTELLHCMYSTLLYAYVYMHSILYVHVCACVYSTSA